MLGPIVLTFDQQMKKTTNWTNFLILFRGLLYQQDLKDNPWQCKLIHFAHIGFWDWRETLNSIQWLWTFGFCALCALSKLSSLGMSSLSFISTFKQISHLFWCTLELSIKSCLIGTELQPSFDASSCPCCCMQSHEILLNKGMRLKIKWTRLQNIYNYSTYNIDYLKVFKKKNDRANSV